MKAAVFSIQKFCTHDGPGIRTTVFFAGCPLDCRWCHNPEGKSLRAKVLLYKDRCIGCGKCLSCANDAQIIGPERKIDRNKCIECLQCTEICPVGAVESSNELLDTEEIFEKVMQDKAFYGTEGGMTLSGGEPMMQPDAAIALFQKAKEAGISTALETSGAFPKKYIPKLVPLVDTFLWDYKDSDEKRFFENTGGNLSDIVENLKYAAGLGANIVLRCILIHGINTDKAHAKGIKRLAEELCGLKEIDLIPYHPMGNSKYEKLGINDGFDSKEKIPTAEDIALFKDTLDKWDVRI